MKELRPEESDGEVAGEEEEVEAAAVEEEEGDRAEEEEEALENSERIPSLEDLCETNIEKAGAEHSASGLRRRNRPE